MWVGVEHLQKFAKINLANLVIWQLAKIYAKLKRGLSPRVCNFGLGKLRKEGFTGRSGHGQPKSGGEGPRRQGAPAAREDRGKGFTEARGTDFGV